MLNIRLNEDRGHANHGWLDTHFTFSFSNYYDPEHMGFRALRVINEDFIAPGMGFGTHPHNDMEILSYVLSGELGHKDSLGSGGVIRHGDVQFMSAGTGIRHSEANPSSTETTHMLQIWLLPNRNGLDPKYEQKTFPIDTQPNRLHLIASRDGRNESFLIRSDAEVYAGKLEGGTTVDQAMTGNHGWVQVAVGEVTVNGKTLQAGDGLAIDGESWVQIVATDNAEILLFDLG
ncbi:MAG TPA: pirin family protein [Acidobacteriaceae bacterium]|nr:pirin family protein [Acidobacteriaceae bacterium]